MGVIVGVGVGVGVSQGGASLFVKQSVQSSYIVAGIPIPLTVVLIP